MQSDILFENILLTDSEDDAKQFAASTFAVKFEKEQSLQKEKV